MLCLSNRRRGAAQAQAEQVRHRHYNRLLPDDVLPDAFVFGADYNRTKLMSAPRVLCGERSHRHHHHHHPGLRYQI